MVFILAYLVLLHIILAVCLVKTDVLSRIATKTGFAHFMPEITPYYKTALASQLNFDSLVPEGSIIFIGDSITQGLFVSAVTDRGVNLGIGGDTTIGVLRRLGQYKCLNTASAIVIAVGINDLPRRDNEQIIGNYKKIAERLPKDVPVFLSSILPVDEKIGKRPLNKRIAELNNGLKKICCLYDNCTFINTAANLKDSTGNLKDECHNGDGMHLSKAGYVIWAKSLHDLLSRNNISCMQE